MYDSTTFKKVRWAMLLATLSLLAVPAAQAKPIAFRHFNSQQGETAQGIKADGLRLQAMAKAYQTRQGGSAPIVEDRIASVQQQREAKALSQQLGSLDPAIATVVARNSASSNSPAPISENSPVEQRLQPQSPVSVPSTGRSFDWRDAGIGAGLAALLTSMLVLGMGTVVTRKRVSHA
jgi:hypothetical protein